MGDEKTCEDRFHLASLVGTKRVLNAVRSHWGIENSLHWTLDLAFDEDCCRLRKGNGPENLAILRHIAINLLKQEKTCQRSIKGKRLLAGWKEDYLLKVLSGLSLASISMRLPWADLREEIRNAQEWATKVRHDQPQGFPKVVVLAPDSSKRLQ